MRYVISLLTAVVLSLSCHNREEAEEGAAPDRGDTSAVAADTSYGLPTDSTMGQVPDDTSSYGRDTSAVGMPNDTSLIRH